MIGELFAIIEKNIRRLLRSKISALIILLGPILLMGVVGIAFNNIGLFGIKINVYSENYEETVENLIQKLESKQFEVKKVETNETCIENVKNGFAHVCIQFHTDDVAGTKIQFYLDFSRVNLVFTLLEALSGRFADESKKISLGLTQELINKLKETSGELKNKSAIISEMRDNAEALGVELVLINEEVSAMNVGMDFSGFDLRQMRKQTSENRRLIGDYEDSLEEGVSDNRQKLEAFEQLAIGMSGDLDFQIENRDEVLENIQSVFDALECSSKEVVNLYSYLDSPDLAGIISSLESPTCSFLFTYKYMLEDSTSELDDISAQLDDLIDDISDAKEGLDDFEEESSDLLSESKKQLNSVDNTIDSVELSISVAEMKMQQIDNAKSNLSSKLSLMEDSLESNLEKFDLITTALADMNEKLGQVSVISPESIVNPIQTEIKPLDMNKTSLDYLFPSLIVLLVMFISILLAGTLIMKEKSSSAYFRNFITPTSNFIFILGTYITTLLLAFVQILFVIIIGSIFFDVSILNNIFIVLLIVVFVITIFSLIGMVIGNLFQSEETATLTSIIISCVLFLFSSTIIPLEQMSRTVANIARMSPFVVSEIMLRKAIIFGAGISFDINLLILFLNFVILSFLTVLSFKIAQREEIGN